MSNPICEKCSGKFIKNLKYGALYSADVELENIGYNKWKCPECGEIYDIDEDDYYDDEERISVYEAAQIWASHGKDEDYMFGYTEEELENAL